jgi:hypothetical protein
VSRPDKLEDVVSAIQQSAVMICSAVQVLTGVTAGAPAQLAASLNGVAGRSVAKSLYPNRGRAGR